MAEERIKISELAEITEVKDGHFIPVDDGNLTNKISIRNYNSSSNQTAQAYARQAQESAETAADTVADIDTKVQEATNQADRAQLNAGAASQSADNAALYAQNSQNYANVAQGHATNAAASAASALDSADASNDYSKLARSWAEGNTGVREDENTNNARYWANVARTASQLTIDPELDPESTNPVENRAIAGALENMHTGGSNIRVFTEESTLFGREVNITDGTVTVTGTFSATGEYTFEGVQMTGTLTVTATDGTQTANDSLIVPYFGNYEKQIAFWAAHVTVTTNKSQFNGLEVTVKKDGTAIGKTIFSNGSAIYTASSPGTYKFEVSYGWNSWESTPLSVTEETDYSTTLNGFICPITVTTPSTEFYGQTVTVSSDGEAPTSTINFDDSGNASYEALEAASYTFEVTYEGDHYRNGITVSSESGASVQVKYWTANVNVTTPTTQMYGLTVTAKDGDDNTVGTAVFDNSGVASFDLHSEGIYHFECTLGWRTFKSDEVAVTAETTYSATIEGFVATINITSKSPELALADVVITCSGVPTSTVKLPVTIPGSVSYTAYKEGTYTLTTTYDGKDYSDTVEVEEQVVYTAKINTHNDVVFAFHYSENDSSPASVTYPEGYTNTDYSPFQMNLSTGVPDYGSWNPKGDNADDVSWLFPRSCMLNYDGTVAYYLDEDDETKKEDGTASDVANSSFAGNAMMEWAQDDNPIYWKLVPDADGKGFTFVCANYKHDEDMEPWNHYNCKGEVAKHFYLPKYFGSSDGTRLRSISGGSNYVNNQATSELALAKKNNLTTDEIWNTEVAVDWIFFYLVCCLIGKNMNTQAVFGSGRCASNNTSAIGQGTMNGKGMFYGRNDQTSGVKVFGMENPWGNLWRRIAGLMYVSGQIRLKLTYTQLDGSTVDGYNTTGNGYLSCGAYSPNKAWGYVSHMKVEKNYIVASTGSGSETTYYCDGWCADTSVTAYAFVGGNWAYAGLGGGFSCYLSHAVSNANASSGAAVSCKPLAGG